MANSSLASEAGPNPAVYSITVVTRVITVLFLLMVTNFNFTIYHLYMRKKPEFSNRLLNVLYSFHASLLQFGSFLILLIFCLKSTYYYDRIRTEYKKFIPSLEVLIMIRMFHLCCVFVNIFFIGMASVIQNFRMDLYLLISMKITRKIVCAVTFFISIITNVLVNLSIKEKEKDGENYRISIERVCACLNMMAMVMCLMVIVRCLIFYLKTQFFIFVDHARKYFLQQRVTVTPIVTIEMEMSQFEVNTDALETFNTNSNVINPTIHFEEYIRLVLLNDCKVFSFDLIHFT